MTCGDTPIMTVMTVSLYIPACTPESFDGQGAMLPEFPVSLPGPSPAAGKREIRESRMRLSH